MHLLIWGAIIFVVGAVYSGTAYRVAERLNRFVGTELEPYVAVAFCAAVALSFTLMFVGVIALMEDR